MDTLADFYLKQNEPIKGTLLTLRDIILKQDKNITNTLKYGMPFFSYKGKMFCYLWVHKKEGRPYIGFVEGKHLMHPNLIQENRSRMKIMLFDANKDLPIKTITILLKQALALYKSGIIKVV